MQEVKVVIFYSSGCRIYNCDNQLIATGTLNLANDIFRLKMCMPTCPSETDNKHVTLIGNLKSETETQIWHRHLVHINSVSLLS